MSNLYVNNIKPVVTGTGVSVSGSLYVSGSEGIIITGSIRQLGGQAGEHVTFQDFVGIGNTEPTKALHVTGDALITGDLTVSGTFDANVEDFKISANTVVLGDESSDSVTIRANAVTYPVSVSHDCAGDFTIDADGDHIMFKFGGADGRIDFTNENSGDGVIQQKVDAKDLVIKQFDGTEVARFTDAGSVEVKDNLSLKSDSSVIKMGANEEVTLTHVHDEGITLTNTISDTDNRPIILTLKSEEDAIVADDVIGTINITAGDSDGTDAAAIAASIEAIAEGAFGANANATTINFKTGDTAPASTKMTLDSGGDLKLVTDSAVLGFGADNDTTLTHTDGTGLTLNSTNKLCFNDASQFIQGSSATVMEIGATDEIGLTATLVDMDANLDLDGTADISGLLTVQTGIVPDAQDGAYLGTTSLQWSDLFLADEAVVSFGDDNEITLTHVHEEGITLTNTIADTDNKPVILTLKSEEDAIVADDVIGTINITAGDSSGTDAAAIAASIEAIAEGAFDTNANATTINFKTGDTAPASTKMKLDSTGDLSLTTDSSVIKMGADNDITLTHDGTTGLTIAANPVEIDSGGNITLDAHTGIFVFQDANTEILRITEGNSGDVTIKQAVNGKDLAFADDDDVNVLKLKNGGSVEVADNLSLTSDAAVFNMGVGNDFTITHDGTTGATIAGSPLIIDGGSTIELSASVAVSIENDLHLASDSSALKFGLNKDIVLTHEADRGLIITQTTETTSEPVLTLKNSGDLASGPYLDLYHDNQADEEDDEIIGGIRFWGVDSGDAATNYGMIRAYSSDVTAGDEGGKVSIFAYAGGTAGSAAATELLTIGGEDVANTTNCAVIVNETGIDCDFRVESNDEAHFLFVDAATNSMQVGNGDGTPAATFELTNHATAGAFDLPLMQLNSNDVDKQALDINAANTTSDVVHIKGDAITTGRLLNIECADNDTTNNTKILLEVDYDHSAEVAANQALDVTGIDINLDDGTQNHADSKVKLYGMNIVVDSESNQGSITNTGLQISVDQANADTAHHIKLINHASGSDYFAIIVKDNGQTTFESHYHNNDNPPGDIIFEFNPRKGKLTLESKQAIAGGGGSGNGLTQSIHEINNVIETVIKYDIGTDSIQASGTDNDAIGKNNGSNATLTQINTDNHGVIWGGYIACIEQPAGAIKDIDLVFSTDGNVDYNETLSGATALATAGGDWTLGKKIDLTIPSGGLTNSHYLYLRQGNGGTAGTYSAGKFIIRLYGG